MRYSSGELVRLGDKIWLWPGVPGVVVCSMDTDEYSEEHPEEQWGYLGKGVMIETPELGLFHYDVADEDMELVERVNPEL